MAVADIHSFHTIQSVSEGIYKEKGSKFLGFAYPVSNESEIKSRLEGLRKKYFDASHHCYAWMLGADKKRFRAFDDGEPSHSAGTPILGQIKSKNLTNVFVVVVRYFGGTKLGVGGLTQAYKAAAEAALANAKIIEVEITSMFILNYDYTSSADVMQLVKDFDLVIENQEYDVLAKLKVSVKLKHKENFLKKLKLLNAIGVKVAYEEEWEN
ncbi:MAG: YigZ family protein [Bacteroidetes bacterium]|nr:YigZ family protein [Bacteroidota bacterium]